MKPVDLTLTITQDIPTFPGSPRPMSIPWNSLKKDGYNLEMLFFSSHTGTHIDAPFHFVQGGKKIHQIDPGRFLCDAVLVRARSGPNHSITKSDIVDHEKRHGAIPGGGAIIFATGWNDQINRRNFFDQNPGLAESAAEYLASKKPSLVGIDSPSIDVGSNKRFSAHHILLKKDVLILENLCNLSRIKSRTFKIAALPLKLHNATGSPVRAVAF